MSDLKLYQAEIAPEQVQVDEALARLRSFEITDEAALDWAADLLRNAKTRAKELDERRKEITGPILLAKAGIDGLFKPLISRYEQAEGILKGKIADWTNRVEAQRRAVMVASAEEFAAGGTPTALIPEPARAEGISVRKVWDFEITDGTLVPRDYCSPDAKKIRAQVPSEGQPPEIPGVRFFQRDQVAARTKG